MKKHILIICLALLSAIVCGCGNDGNAKETQNIDMAAVSSEAPLANQVVAYYFHGNYRCASCLRIEQYSKEAIEKYYAEELKSGKLVFRVINVEEKGNEHYVNDYQLYTKSLVLSLVKDGKEAKSENLAKVWELLGNREGFYGYVKTSVDVYLGELPK